MSLNKVTLSTSGLRPLTDEEADLVAGGVDLKPGKYYWDTNGNGKYDADEKVVVVEPQLSPVNDDGGGGGDWYGYDFSTATYYEESGGGMGGPNTVPPEDCRDREALEAKQLINGEDNNNTNEFGILIYRGADGQLHKSSVLRGANGEIPRSVIESWMRDNGVSMSQVEGFVHNHDAWHYERSYEEGQLNRYPSGGASVGGGDWAVADWMVSAGAGGAGGAGFALYIIDTDGDLREFEYSARNIYFNLDADERERGESLPPELVSDGSSCS